MHDGLPNTAGITTPRRTQMQGGGNMVVTLMTDKHDRSEMMWY